MKSGPERELMMRYLERLKASGKQIGISSVDEIEIVESRAQTAAERKAAEASALLEKLPSDAVYFCFDERGASPTSLEFSGRMQDLLDSGTGTLGLVVGGPDGLDGSIRQKAQGVIAFGSLTMPHQVVRILVAEQAYRAITILTGHPYHRE